MMNRLLLLLGFFTLVLSWTAVAQPQLTARIDAPVITVNSATMWYDPMPFPVQMTVINTGTAASAPLSVRIVLPPPMTLDPGELSQTIKSPVPASVLVNDSAKVSWKVQHPASFTPVNLRIGFWVIQSPTDSFYQSRTVLLPALTPPNLKMNVIGVSPLAVRPDSLGYDGNPFSIAFRMTNTGGTQADSVRIVLHLPQDYILDPPTQSNPYLIPGSVLPSALTSARYDFDWTVRYRGATIQPRVDTFRVIASGRDLAGGVVLDTAIVTVTVPGLSPAFTVDASVPVIRFDAAQIYDPQPFTVTARVSNPGSQVASLRRITLHATGVGITPLGPTQRNMDALPPGGTRDETFAFIAERRSADRQIQFTVDIADADGRIRGDVTSGTIPGKPYKLEIVDFSVPDTIPLNTEGTDFLNHPTVIPYAFFNDTWYDNDVMYRRVSAPSGMVQAPVVHVHTDTLRITPSTQSVACTDEFEFVRSTEGQSATITVMGVTHRGDTAVAQRRVFIPGLRPVASLSRTGPDTLDYSAPAQDYVPNPYIDRLVLRNDGIVTFKVDSLVIRYDDDGMLCGNPVVVPVGYGLVAGDSIGVNWQFTAEARPYDRTVHCVGRAHYVSREMTELQWTVVVPAVEPSLQIERVGPDSLVYDPVTVYRPNPFTKALRITNTGRAAFPLDSITLWCGTAGVSIRGTGVVPGTMIQPGANYLAGVDLQAESRPYDRDVELRWTLISKSWSTTVQDRVHIPAIGSGPTFEAAGDDVLHYDARTKYAPSPFQRWVTVINRTTGSLRLDSAKLTISNELSSGASSRHRVLNQFVLPGDSMRIGWDLTVPQRLPDTTAVPVAITVYHSGDRAGETLTKWVLIPGELFGFRLNVTDPPRDIALDGTGTQYDPPTIITRFTATNESWTTIGFRRAEIRVSDPRLLPLTALDRLPQLSLDAAETSVARVDSFAIPAMDETTVTMTFIVEDGEGIADSATYSFRIPQLRLTGATSAPSVDAFGFGAVYPTVVTGGGAISFSVRVPAGRHAQVTVHDLFGRQVAMATIVDSPGEQIRHWSPGGLPPGNYFFRMTDGESVATRRFVLLRQ